jgi:hypothetical protein
MGKTPLPQNCIVRLHIHTSTLSNCHQLSCIGVHRLFRISVYALGRKNMLRFELQRSHSHCCKKILKEKKYTDVKEMQSSFGFRMREYATKKISNSIQIPKVPNLFCNER